MDGARIETNYFYLFTTVFALAIGGYTLYTMTSTDEDNYGISFLNSRKYLNPEGTYLGRSRAENTDQEYAFVLLFLSTVVLTVGTLSNCATSGTACTFYGGNQVLKMFAR
tara:strand:- start:442 stop:771 length:330 start_codon:yes stop_codon:yes gene_type:complete